LYFSTFQEHRLTIKELAEQFPESNINVDDPPSSKGLSNDEADRRLLRDGSNVLAPPAEISNVKLFLRQFLNLFWILLIGAAILSLMTYFLDTKIVINLYTAIVLILIVLIMCVVTFFEEKKAISVVKGFTNLLPTKCSAIRGGEQIVINTENVAVGDIVIIKNGSRVPADMRVLWCSDLKLEASSITGEAEPIEYNYEPVAEHIDVFDANNVAFNGSFCVDGDGIGLVIRTGERTIIGQIASLTTTQTETKSSLEVEINRFVKFVFISALIMGFMVFLIGCIMTKFEDILGLFSSGFLVVIVANVPQGLPATVTSELTIIARRMAKKNVFMKKLGVVDAFGAATVIASDKTGTLTTNDMAVTDAWAGLRYINGVPEIRHRTLNSIRNQPGGIGLEVFEKPIPDLIAVMTLCNKAQIELRNQLTMRPRINPSLSTMCGGLSADRKITGTPSEVALLRYADKVANIVFEIPFNSVRKYHLIIVQEVNVSINRNDYCKFILMIKGAPEVLITKCSHIAHNEGDTLINEDLKMDFQDAYEHFGNNGRRVIGFAKKEFETKADTKFIADEQNFPTSNLIFIGMVGIMDPPRPDTASAIAQCKESGIKVFMVTGDHPSTATAIAKEIGLVGEKEKVTLNIINIITGFYKYPSFSILLTHNYIVFARTTPEQKLLIVEKCQARGEIVCVTGDGVNDAPALKKANIGVAMGVTGSDVAKQAADVVLMDDNFASIVKGIEEGRLLFDNLRKTIAYTLTHTIPEVVPIVLNFLLGVPMAITSLQILSIDLGTEITPAISLAYENAEKDILNKPPRKQNTRLVNFTLLLYSYILAAGIVIGWSTAAYLYVYSYHGISLSDLFFSAQKYFKYNAVGNFTSNGNLYDEAEQVNIRNQAASAYYLTLVMSQAFHIWMCSTRRISFFQHGVNNTVTIYAVVIEVLLIIIFIYTPGIQFVMGSSPPPYKAWYFCIGSGICLWVFNEMRKYGIRHWPKHNLVRLFKW
ncbi:unnamed protein product, partial [Dracunculus medinensis]|uniref:Cation_ATPase_N domain-containing protein n=1 Tax=Dracunculus medinensis TaxID=318479 RepID=A0A158Q603_DRAME